MPSRILARNHGLRCPSRSHPPCLLVYARLLLLAVEEVVRSALHVQRCRAVLQRDPECGCVTWWRTLQAGTELRDRYWRVYYKHSLWAFVLDPIDIWRKWNQKILSCSRRIPRLQVATKSAMMRHPSFEPDRLPLFVAASCLILMYSACFDDFPRMLSWFRDQSSSLVLCCVCTPVLALRSLVWVATSLSESSHIPWWKVLGRWESQVLQIWPVERWGFYQPRTGCGPLW